MRGNASGNKARSGVRIHSMRPGLHLEHLADRLALFQEVVELGDAYHREAGDTVYDS